MNSMNGSAANSSYSGAGSHMNGYVNRKSGMSAISGNSGRGLTPASGQSVGTGTMPIPAGMPLPAGLELPTLLNNNYNNTNMLPSNNGPQVNSPPPPLTGTGDDGNSGGATPHHIGAGGQTPMTATQHESLMKAKAFHARLAEKNAAGKDNAAYQKGWDPNLAGKRWGNSPHGSSSYGSGGGGKGGGYNNQHQSGGKWGSDSQNQSRPAWQYHGQNNGNGGTTPYNNNAGKGVGGGADT